ncbi:MAG: SAM-dependent chlorinase/fluorinase, partial [candidate division WOR-3 bacterium]
SLIVCVIDPDVGTDRKIIALYKIEKDMIFLAPDNGLLYSLFSQDDKIFIIDEDTFWLKPLSNTFHGRDIFAPVSAFISLGVPIITLGTKAKVDEITKLEIPQPYVGGDYIEGISLFRDPFGNIITNIDEELIKDKRIANITVGDKKVSGLYKNFSEAKGKGLSATVGSFGTIEIFVYLDSAADVIGNFKDLRVKITFE